jgi:NADH-quinone oxidoreductase subunit G
MIIEAADEAGFTIPRFCYHKKLSIAANCRMCLVEVEKVPKPLPACATPVTEGMKVFTRSPKAIEAQRGTMEFLLINHPLDCPICDQGGECELQEVSIGFGSGYSEFDEDKRVVADKDIGPLISTEMTRCIHCTRCVRFGDEIAGMRELGATGRGENTRIGTYIEKAITSEMSGNVIDLCPVGALTSRPFRFTARAWEMIHRPSIAAHDCIGSHLEVLTRGDQVMRVDPRENEELNEVWLSDRDRFSYEALNSDERLQRPLIRQQGKWQETDWNTALEYTVTSLQKLINEQGAGQLGALASPSSTLEEQYLLARLMRGLGCHNIDHRLRQQDFSGQQYDAVYPWLGQTVAGLENQDAILLIGSNVQKDQPIIGHRIRKASLKSAVIMAVNAVDYSFNFPVQHKCISAPAQMVSELAAIAIAAQEKQGVSVTSGLPELLNGMAVQDRHRLIAEQLSKAANSAVLLGSQAALHPAYAQLQTLVALISEASGARLGILSQGANSAGACLAGCLPHRDIAGVAADQVGLDARAMLEANLKAYVLLNVEAESDCADAQMATNALMDAQFVVSLSAFKSKAIEKYADVILPVAPFTETSGTFVNVEGQWQGFSAVVAPLGEARPAWKVLRVLGNLFDVDGFDYVSSAEITAELEQACAGVTIDNKRHAPLTGLAPAIQGLARIADVPLYAVDAITRRARSLQMTADAAPLAAVINSAEAARLSLSEAVAVNVQQQGEQQRLPLMIDERIPDGCVMIAAGVTSSDGLGNYGAAVQLTASSN